jgi:DNA-binding response OmpR family regulator
MPHRILVVDDEEPILFALREYFTALGYEVDAAREAEEAESCLARTRYDLVIADLRLCGSHGAQGLDVLTRAREHAPSTRTILLTAYGSPEVEREARHRGVDALLHKPKPLPEVARIVVGLLGTPS